MFPQEQNNNKNYICQLNEKLNKVGVFLQSLYLEGMNC